jgi:hypothetical protein
MNKKIASFAPGACVKNGVFLALLLKFKMDDQSDFLTAWPLPLTTKFFQEILEFEGYLRTTNEVFDSGLASVELKRLSPIISKSESEHTPATSVVQEFSTYIVNNELHITIVRAKQTAPDLVILKAHHAEWLMGFIGATLAEFDQDSALFEQTGAQHCGYREIERLPIRHEKI